MFIFWNFTLQYFVHSELKFWFGDSIELISYFYFIFSLFYYWIILFLLHEESVSGTFMNKRRLITDLTCNWTFATMTFRIANANCKWMSTIEHDNMIDDITIELRGNIGRIIGTESPSRWQATVGYSRNIRPERRTWRGWNKMEDKTETKADTHSIHTGYIDHYQPQWPITQR